MVRAWASGSRCVVALRRLQLVAGALVLARLARGRRRLPPLRPPTAGRDGTVSVVVPARDEAARIAECLAGVDADQGVDEIVVVDDGSTDATAEIARHFGARVVAAGQPPAGWVGKPWALQQGLEAARGDFVISLDADTRPQPGLSAALVAALDDADFVTAGARFICDSAAERWLHPALLATLVYRFGPPDSSRRPRPGRLLANGQCTAVRRRDLLRAGGYAAAARHMTDDAALARALVRLGWRIAFRDGSRLVAVDMHDSVRDTWREWGRSIALRDVTTAPRLAADVALTWLTLGLPPLQVVMRRGGAVAGTLVVVRVLVALALAPSYGERGPAYWLSPLADPLAAVRLTLSALHPSRRWRGRSYPLRLG
jgi:dolichol-phosphate mannosyltransferase